MSRTVENRVVEMQFQNKQFEDAVAQSRQSIQLLEKDLKLLEGVQALKNLDSAISQVDFSGIQSGINTLKDRFSDLGIISMTVLQNITNSITSSLLGALSSAASAVTGVFSTIYQKGLNRAKNIEQANFALQGLLSTEYKVRDANGEWIADMDTVKSKMKDISKVIDASVSGTAYGYDQAARVASTLAASYGTSAEGIANIGEALKSIVGMAGQTGQDFDIVARVFTKVAASGKAMSAEINSVSGWGVGATAMIAKYINADKSLTKQMNASLKTKKNYRSALQEITEADVYDLASKGKITSDMFIDVFAPFFENAQKANDTLSGVTANIGAALGRLGVSFIEPIMMNEGPLVNFLKVVRQKIVDVKNAIEDLDIPQNFTETVTNFLEKVTNLLDGFDVSKLEIFNKIANSINNIHDALTIQGDFGKWDTYTSNFAQINDIYDKYVKYDPLETFSRVFDFGIDVSQRRATEDQLEYLERTYGRVKREYDRWKKDLSDPDKTNTGPFMYLYTYDRKRVRINVQEAMQAYDELMEIEENRTNLTARIQEAERKTLQDSEQMADREGVFSYNYLQNLYDGLGNIAQAFANIKNIFNDLFTSVGGPVKIIWDLITGNNADNSFAIRDFINGLSESFLNFTNRIKDFTENNESFRDILTAIGNIFIFIGNVGSAAWTILKSAFTSFTPLLERIFNFIGAIADTINGLADTGEENTDIWTSGINAICYVVDILAKALTTAWDVALGFLGIFAPSDIEGTIGKFYDILRVIGDYIGTNFPIWVEKAKPYIEWFIGKVQEAAEFLKEKLGVAIDWLSPYFDSFVGWLSDITDGAVDLSEPMDDINNILGKTSDVMEDVDGVVESVSNHIGAAAVGLSAPVNVLGSVLDIFDGLDLEEKAGSLGLFSEEVEGDGEKVVKPWQKFKNIVETIYTTVKDWFKKRLDDFGILEDGQTITDFIGGIIEKVKNWIGNIDADKVLEFLGKVAQIASGSFLAFSAGKGHMNITKAISELPAMFTSISGTIQSFSPFYADVMKADNKTTRRQALADIIKSFAYVIGAVALAFLAFGIAMEKIGSLNEEQFERAAGAMATMGIVMIILIAALLGVMAIFMSTNKTETKVTNNPIVQKISDIKGLYGFIRNGQLYDQTKEVTDNGSNAWKSMAAIGAVIGAFAASVLIISAAVWALGRIPEDKLNQGMLAFMEIASIIVILMILLGAFAYLLSGSSRKDNSEIFGKMANDTKYGVITQGKSKTKDIFTSKESGDWKVLAAMGVAIALIAGAMTGIIWAISLVSNIPMAHIDKGIQVFSEVALATISIVALIGLMAIGMTYFSRKGGKSIAGSLVVVGVIMSVVLGAMGGLIMLLAEVALLPINNVDMALKILEGVSDAIQGIVIILGVLVLALSAITGLSEKGEHIASALAAAGFMIAMIGALFLSIGGSFFLIASAIGIIALAVKDLDEAIIGKIVAVLKIITVLVVGVMICVTIMTGLMKKSNNAAATIGLIALLSVLMLSLASIFVAIGSMAKMISESGMSADDIGNIVGMIQTIIIVITAISLVITILMAIGIGEGVLGVIATLSTMFAALAVLFVGIGVAAVLVGAGVNLIVDALMKLIDFFGTDDTESKVKKTQSGLETFMAGLGAIIFAGLIGVATFLDTNKDKVVESIKKIIAFILEAVWAGFVQTFQTNLEGLTQIIEMIDIWLNQNKFEIERIITNFTEIIFTAINAFADNMMKLIFGDDYSGDTSGLLGQLTTALIGWFRTHFLDEGSDGRTLLRDTMNVIGEEVHQGILDFLTFVQNSQDIPVQALTTVDSIICSIGNALVEKGPAIIDHVKNLMKLIWELIKYGLGIRKNPPDASEFQFTPGQAGDPEGVMGEVADDMGEALASTDWTTAVNDFMGKLWNAVTHVITYGLPGLGLLWDLGTKIAEKIVGGVHEGGQGGSPWRSMEQEGIWAMQGIYNGLTNKTETKNIEEASNDIARRTVNIVSDGLSVIGDSTAPFVTGLQRNLSRLGNTLSLMMSGMLDGIEAKISPYLDLTQIEEGFGSIKDMMEGNSEFDITSLTDSDAFSSLSENATSTEGAGNIATDFDEANMPDLSGMNEMMNPETILNFTQNNYSPEALSRIDIYRDTKNMLNNRSVLQNLVPNHMGGGGMNF